MFSVVGFRPALSPAWRATAGSLHTMPFHPRGAIVSVRPPGALLAAVALLAALPACNGQPAPPTVTHRATTPVTTTTEAAPNLLWQTPPAQVWPTLVRAV